MPPLRLTLAAACLAAAPIATLAQVTVKNDGQWRALVTAGASISSGNSDSTSINLNGEAVKATQIDKITLNAKALYVNNDGAESENRMAAGGHYQRDLNQRIFGFAQLDALRDEPANLSSRTSVGAGVGYHVIRRDDLTFDLSTGLGYSRERYVEPEVVDGSSRDSYNNLELILAEESSHRLTDTTTFRQKLTLLPNLRNNDQMRAIFDASLSVAMTSRLALTASVSHRYDSDPGPGLKKGDTLFITGVTFRID
ncbi:MAG: YdiY family protein [Aquincola tertiaricarbonis]|uniref:DUF481 domain-containing protein n=1 Tax=Aquincola TaxID=391952 RepID=UPI0018DB442D|nr:MULTISPECIES: DUF481 domain-containing protein [Aquincola]MCR5866463.1 DUF481 domain-containing protein [Aquincola sp. J276]